MKIRLVNLYFITVQIEDCTCIFFKTFIILLKIQQNSVRNISVWNVINIRCRYIVLAIFEMIFLKIRFTKVKCCLLVRINRKCFLPLFTFLHLHVKVYAKGRKYKCMQVFFSFSIDTESQIYIWL